MPISFDDAKAIALAHIGPECRLVEEATIEKPYGWYFCYQSREFLETEDVGKMLFGSGGFVVEREGGRVFEFGSAYATETWLANYEKGYKYDRYDLTILSVSDLRATLDCLQALDMRFIVPEYAHGETWMIPKEFTRQQLADRLSRLPCVFRNQSLTYRVEELERMKHSGCCHYELRECLAPDDLPSVV